MPPTRPRPITTIASIEDKPDPRTVETTNARTTAEAPRQPFVVTIPAGPPSLTPGLARALSRIIVKAAGAADFVGIAHATDGHAIAS
jgi:hypothetical protein